MPQASLSGSAKVTYASGEDFGTLDSGQWLEEDPQVGAPEYDREFVSAAGDDGCGSKNYGFRNREILLQVLYVRTTPTGVASGIDTDLKEFATGAPLQVVVNGVTYPACFLDPKRSGRLGRVRPWGTLYFGRAAVVVNQKRLN